MADRSLRIKDHSEFSKWYKSSKAYRRRWVPHGIDQLSILRALYRYRSFASGTVLDVGCGTKKFADVYSGLVVAYWGIDLPTAELHRLRTVDAYAEAINLPIRTDSISTVVTTQVLGYVYDHEAMVREIFRVLQPGGRLILTHSQTGGSAGPDEYFHFTPAYYSEVLKRVGLEIEVSESRTGVWGTVGENLSTMAYYRNPMSGLTFRLRCLICYGIQSVFDFLDRIWFEPHGGIGHVVIARKPIR